MRPVERLAALVITVAILTAAMTLVVSEPTVSVVSGMIGAAVPVLLIYGVIQYSEATNGEA